MIRQGVTAHRGNSVAFPENTIPAFQSAIALGVDWIETDVYRTRDGQLAMIHNPTTGATCDRDLPVAESAWADLAKLDAAAVFRRQHRLTSTACPPVRIPRLEDALALIKTQHHTRLSIQPKNECVAEVLARVRELGAESQVGFNDGSLEKMLAVKRANSALPVFWDRGPGDPVVADVAVARQHGFEAMVIHHSTATPETLGAIRDAGIEAGVWTVNLPTQMSRLFDMGAQRFYTDDPRSLIRLNRQRFLAQHAGRPEIIGHRGASHDAPENTLPSIRLAWELGADAVEIDVYLTRDRQIIAMHDGSIKRYTGKDGKPSDLTLAELKQLDFGKWKDAKWAGTRIATLPEILATIPAAKRLVVEIKCGPDIVPVLAEDIRRSGKTADQICFIAFSVEVMQAVKARLPAHEAYWLIGFDKDKDKTTGAWRPPPAEAFATAAIVGVDGLDVSSSGPYDAEFTRQMAENGFLFCVWTINDAETARRFIALGAHSITTDRPGWLREQLAVGKQ